MQNDAVATKLAVKIANLELDNARLSAALEATAKELKEFKDKQPAKKK